MIFALIFRRNKKFNADKRRKRKEWILFENILRFIFIIYSRIFHLSEDEKVRHFKETQLYRHIVIVCNDFSMKAEKLGN